MSKFPPLHYTCDQCGYAFALDLPFYYVPCPQCGGNAIAAEAPKAKSAAPEGEAALRSRIQDLESKLALADAALAIAQEDYAKFEEEIVNAEGKLADAAKTIADLTGDLANERDERRTRPGYAMLASLQRAGVAKIRYLEEELDITQGLVASLEAQLRAANDTIQQLVEGRDD